jgi:hypothetical protein
MPLTYLWIGSRKANVLSIHRSVCTVQPVLLVSAYQEVPILNNATFFSKRVGDRAPFVYQHLALRVRTFGTAKDVNPALQSSDSCEDQSSQPAQTPNLHGIARRTQ